MHAADIVIHGCAVVRCAAGLMFGLLWALRQMDSGKLARKALKGAASVDGGALHLAAALPT